MVLSPNYDDGNDEDGEDEDENSAFVCLLYTSDAADDHCPV